MLDMTGEEIISLLENYNVKIKSHFECHFPISRALALRTFGFEKQTINIWNPENGVLKQDERYTGSLLLHVIKDNGDRVPDYDHKRVYSRDELVEALDSIVELDRISEKMYRKELLDAV